MPTPAAPALDRFYAQRIHWAHCSAGFAAADFATLSGLDCGTVSVPLDYQHPQGRTLAIAVARVATTGRHRIGSLLVDPGGPGGSGLSYVAGARSVVPEAVRDRFDIVGFDPRGVGASSGFHCLSTQQQDALGALPPVPAGPAQVAALVATDEAFATGCARAAGGLLPFLGTVDAARDLDLIRSAVGDAKLTYLGKSYGTLLGAVYADEFPTRVRALVLDGALPPDLDPATRYRQQAAGFETDLDDFLGYCVEQRKCPWSGSAAAARTGLDALLAKASEQPIATSSSRRLHAGEVFGGVSAGLYSTGSWPALVIALANAVHGNGSLLLSFSDDLAGRHGSAGYDTISSAFPAISCADQPMPYTTEQAARYAAEWAAESPLYGPAEAWSLLACTSWVHSESQLPTRVRAAGGPPIVVVGTTRDPATPYRWAQDLAAELASGVLVTRVGDGHTAYGSGRSQCVDDAVNRYLIDAVPPSTGFRCS